MKIEINILDVGDADAILVYLKKQDKNLVMVIDAGRSKDYGKTVRPALDKLLKSSGKAAPDIVVCTHYDSDHIGGLIPLVEEFGAGIAEVWVHHPLTIVNEDIPVLEEYKEYYNKMRDTEAVIEPELRSLINSTIEPGDIGKLLTPFPKFMNVKQKKIDINFVLESITEYKELIEVIPHGKQKENFASDTPPLKEWPEIKILGPLQSYYESLFPSSNRLGDLIKQESYSLNEGLILEKRSHDNNRLKQKQEMSLSKVNRASFIICIDIDQKKFLFTGDAGVASFEAIPDWEDKLKDIYWLKIPHHGSNNNLTKELIEIMSPVYAYSSGNEYESEAILNCIKSKHRNKSVCSTKHNGTLRFTYPLVP